MQLQSRSLQRTSIEFFLQAPALRTESAVVTLERVFPLRKELMIIFEPGRLVELINVNKLRINPFFSTYVRCPAIMRNTIDPRPHGTAPLILFEPDP